MPTRTRRQRSGQAALIAVLVFAIVGLVAGAFWYGRNSARAKGPTVTHDTIVDAVQKVSQLVSAKVYVRDMFFYSDKKHFSTKKALMLVQGHLNFGIDLPGRPEVQIDDQAHRVAITLPHARILDVGDKEVDIRMLDNGLFNKFSAERLTTLMQSADSVLRSAGDRLGVTDYADASAAATLRMLLARDGYSVDIEFKN